MRLLHVHIITEYKNLKDFKIDFDGSSFIDVFVGKNGTGKSNLFEAIIEIFRHLFDNDYPIYFEYLIKYEIEDQELEIKWVNTTNKNRVSERLGVFFVYKRLTFF
ncbi:AAA family ATPase [Arenibacter sp. M-2]|uniref:AAA family ATPase n=1 Tax=Arenibacter sp. M-2 TaxID=3053612 RepID=UPI002570F87B|nr:AAA family ATPase [Arenibacter sp. M-2]MDL5515069.1 AAA family ATPase [Arenibacter sp. M-2]